MLDCPLKKKQAMDTNNTFPLASVPTIEQVKISVLEGKTSMLLDMLQRALEKIGSLENELKHHAADIMQLQDILDGGDEEDCEYGEIMMVLCEVAKKDDVN